MTPNPVPALGLVPPLHDAGWPDLNPEAGGEKWREELPTGWRRTIGRPDRVSCTEATPRGQTAGADAREVVVFGDVHLSSGRPDVWELYDRFLARLDRTRLARLVCLGDLYDAYAGVRTLNARERGVRDQLVEIAAAGVAVDFIRGNRDFLVGRGFADRGIGVHANWMRLAGELPGGRGEVWLTHGDNLMLRDRLHQRARRLLRSRVVMATADRLPRAVMRTIAQKMRAGSVARHARRAAAAATARGERERVEGGVGLLSGEPGPPARAEVGLVARLLGWSPGGEPSPARACSRVLVMGHVHQPLAERYPNGGRFLTVGDWSEAGAVIARWRIGEWPGLVWVDRDGAVA